MIPDRNIEVLLDERLNSNSNVKRLRIVHFNDVYNIEPAKDEPVGGAARFAKAIETFTKKNSALLAFSGDAVSPSTCKF